MSNPVKVITVIFQDGEDFKVERFNDMLNDLLESGWRMIGQPTTTGAATEMCSRFCITVWLQKGPL